MVAVVTSNNSTFDFVQSVQSAADNIISDNHTHEISNNFNLNTYSNSKKIKKI